MLISTADCLRILRIMFPGADWRVKSSLGCAVERIQSTLNFKLYANVECVSDPAFAGVTAEDVLQLAPADYEHGFLLVVDQETVSSPEKLVLVVDLDEEPGRSFRAPPAEIQGIENNLSLANLFFWECADAVDENGVFRLS